MILMGNPEYRADQVDARETRAMDLFQLTFMEGGLNGKCVLSFNIVKYGESYRVQSGYTENNQFVRVGETPDIPIPSGWNLEKVAEEELRFPGDNVNVFLNGKLHTAASTAFI